MLRRKSLRRLACPEKRGLSRVLRSVQRREGVGPLDRRERGSEDGGDRTHDPLIKRGKIPLSLRNSKCLEFKGLYKCSEPLQQATFDAFPHKGAL